jgi:hypothetical protein
VREPLIRLVEIVVALGYGAVLGSHLPLPAPAEVLALPPVSASRPAPAEPLVLHATLVAGFDAASHPAPAERRRAPGARAPLDAGTPSVADTLPAAPSRSVPQAIAPAGWQAPSTARQSGGGSCVGEEAATDPACRAAIRRRLASMCPRDGDTRHRGPVVCIRSED